MRRRKRIAVGLATLLAAGSVGALENNPILAPLTIRTWCAPMKRNVPDRPIDQLKLWRGAIICTLCAAYLLLFVDYSKPLAPGAKTVYVIVLLAGMLGMVLYFFDYFVMMRKRREDREK